MKEGAIVPQGWVGEYDGWDTHRNVERKSAMTPAR